jgi:hypothetical protein
METIQMNLTSPVYGYKALNVTEMTECNGELLISLSGKECYDIYQNQQLMFKRYIYENDRQYKVLTEYVTVLNEDENHVLHTTMIPNRKVELYKNITHISGNTEEGEKYEFFIIKCRKGHNLFPQDIIASFEEQENDDEEKKPKAVQEIVIKDYEDNELIICSAITIPLKYFDRATTSADCITFVESAETCGHDYRKIDFYKYDFLPDKVSRDKIIISGVTYDEIMSIAGKMSYFETKFNPFYYYEIETNENGEPNEFNQYNEPYKHCYFYKDLWWKDIDDKQKERWGDDDAEEPQADDILDNKKYVNSGNTRSELGVNNAFWNVSVGMATPMNETTLGSSDNFGTSFVKDIEESLIPEIIDMERVKYAPMVWSSGDVLSVATSITLNFHFRQRYEIKGKDDEEDKKLRLQNTPFSSGNVYYDEWYIHPESADTIWWNGVASGESAFTKINFSEFINESGETSDLLGYLNFTDNDVYYRKKKVSQSFVRLTFYNSKDPIEQKLLYYSTVFLDGTILYGKYVRQLLFNEDNDIDTSDFNQNAVIVFCSANTVSARVDTQMVITNEYDRTKSAEGFNLYLFAEDATFGEDENSAKTIYMKVEFNHAGNGKTIPMIMWPKSGDTYVPLTINNFIENLYIPIKITYINDKYVYYIPNAYKNENGNISLVLFEPKLDFDEEEGKDNGEN